jgi:hypothetical protein
MTLADASRGIARAERDASPDSGDLRVSHNTAFESGIPAARVRLDRNTHTEQALEQLERALSESTRAEVNLDLLSRGLERVAEDAAAAQKANALLLQELESLRLRMANGYENESVLQQRVQTLENALEATVRERESWLAQEDAFLVELLDDHEHELAALACSQDRRLAELDHSLDELRQQRDLARTEVMRLTYERDAAVALLGEPIAPNERAPRSSQAVGERTTLGSVKLTKPPLKSKPEISSRPLIGYSLINQDATGELLPTNQRDPSRN